MAVGVDRGADAFVQVVEVFAVAFQYGNALARQGFGGVAAGQVF